MQEAQETPAYLSQGLRALATIPTCQRPGLPDPRGLRWKVPAAAQQSALLDQLKAWCVELRVTCAGPAIALARQSGLCARGKGITSDNPCMCQTLPRVPDSHRF